MNDAETYHLTINGAPACEAFPLEPCEHYSERMAYAQLVRLQARLITSTVRVEPGPCPHTGERKFR